MYLEARKFVSGYSHSKTEEQELFKNITEAVGLQDMHDERFATVSVNVGARPTISTTGLSRIFKTARMTASLTTSLVKS
jgi:hypothetical protein